MKSINLVTIFALLIVTIISLSNASGPAANNTRATGAPGDGGNTCVTCHNNSGTFGDISINFELLTASGDAVTEYKPDSVYEVKVIVENSSGTPAGYGFQMICLEDSDDSNYDGWFSPSSNAQLATSAGRDYVEHNAISTTNEFTVNWTAPEAGTGDVSFYIGGNAVNGANGTGGDRAAIDDFTITEAPADTTANNVNELTTKSFSIFPNPVENQATISGLNPGAFVKIYDAKGAFVMQANLMGQVVDLSGLNSGFYVLVHEASNESQKIFKL